MCVCVCCPPKPPNLKIYYSDLWVFVSWEMNWVAKMTPVIRMIIQFDFLFTLINHFLPSHCLSVLWLAICLSNSGHKLGCSQYHHTLQSHSQHCHFRNGQWHMKDFNLLPIFFDWNSRDMTHDARKVTGRPPNATILAYQFLIQNNALHFQISHVSVMHIHYWLHDYWLLIIWLHLSLLNPQKWSVTLNFFLLSK